MKVKTITAVKMAAIMAFGLFPVIHTMAEDVIQPASLPYGVSYQEWSAKWWQWNLSQSTNFVEYVGSPDICFGPASQVRFLAGGPYPTAAVRKITINDQTPLFFPVLSIWVDNSGCPFTDLTVDQLLAEAEGLWSGVTETSCAIDGVEVAGMSNPTNSVYLVQSPPFSYTTAREGNVLAGVYGEPCIDGGTTIYPAVADGIYVMVAPLRVGKHTIHFVGIVGPITSPEVDVDVTYDITVIHE